ncbi:MAG: hypothetical protein AAF411_25560 [Myxococcota bacterium]
MDHEDPDVAEFIAAQKRAKQQGGLNALRVVGASLVAAAVCVAILYGLGALDASSEQALHDSGFERTSRGEMRRGMGNIVVAGFACFAAGSLSFLGAYRLFGGKVDKDTFDTVLRMIGLRR